MKTNPTDGVGVASLIVDEKPHAKKPKASNEHKSGKSAPSKPRLEPAHFGVIGLVVVALAVFGIRYVIFASQNTSTDNAYITNDIIQISPQVSGTVKQVLVSENQVVKAGDPIVVLDDATYKATVAQKQADLDAAIAQARGAGVSVALTTETGSAQVAQAEGVVGQADSSILSARADVAKNEAAALNAVAIAGSADANIKTAQAMVASAIANKRKNVDAVNSMQAFLSAAKASVKAAQAIYDKASHDSQRYSALVAKGAVSKQIYDGAVSAELSAKAQLENAQAMVIQKEADLSSAREQINAADAGIDQANAQLAAARQQANASHMGIRKAKAEEMVARESVLLAQARRQQAAGQLSQAKTSPRQVAVSQSAQVQAMAKVEQAKASLDAAKLQLGYTKIYAPVSGRVSKKSVEVGALVQIGTPLMAIIPENNVWVVANFKETQMKGIRPKLHCEIDVDAIPGKTFTGTVDSVSPATGSTFALLPPDNATGNFVKVVQRVPVKIVLDSGQSDIDLLRAGMSVNAVIKLK